MTVVPLAGGDALDLPLATGAPDRAPGSYAAGDAFARALGDAFADAGSALERADAAERAFAARRGGLQEMVLERARADVAVSLASAAASRTAAAVTTLLGMQV